MTRLFPAVLGILILVVAGCQDASGPGQSVPLRLSGTAVIRAPADLQFTERERSYIAGHKISAGVCVFDRRVHLKKGDKFTERVVEFDPTTCAFILARGDHAASEVASARESTEIGLDGATAIATGARLNLLLGSSSSYAWQRLYHEDPLQIDVTSSRIDLDWSYDGACSYAIRSEHLREWLTNSGWIPLSHSHTMSPRLKCQTTSANAQATASFQNSQFCNQQVAETWYDINKIEGMPDGTAWLSNRGYASGACSDLLTYHYEYGLT